MSDKLRPVTFERLLIQTITEYKKEGTMYYVPVKVRESQSPLGPAAGPHTQLAQNLIAAYAAGAGHMELKTVQVLEGEKLGLLKPCIYVDGVAYNTEWSTELTVQQALEEYVKAWFLIHLLRKEYNLGSDSEITFYMSVGYDLAGIQSEKINCFIDSMKNASNTEIWTQCVDITMKNLDLFKTVTKEDIYAIPSAICDSVTLSTMHGCPSDEIERIVSYLLIEKELNVFLKLNPTLLGVDSIRRILNQMGYGSIQFNESIFHEDISYATAIRLITNSINKAKSVNREFGVKLTNTFPVIITNQELEGDTMYLSGAPLYPIAITIAAKLAKEFEGKLKISYSGGADQNNIVDILDTGIYPVTLSTYLLKPGGYKNISKLNQIIEGYEVSNNACINVSKLQVVAEKARTDSLYYNTKPKKRVETKKEYSSFCALCNHCIDVCPNRANYRTEYDGRSVIIHNDAFCNECGNCSYFCILGHKPYLEKYTIFDSKEDFNQSSNPGIFKNENEEMERSPYEPF